MNYAEAKQLKKEVSDACDLASEVLNKACAPHKGAMGLTSDAFKATEEYKKAKRDFDVSFAKMRNINTWFLKSFKKEYQQEMRNRYK